jgi:hypothetical protein
MKRYAYCEMWLQTRVLPRIGERSWLAHWFWPGMKPRLAKS